MVPSYDLEPLGENCFYVTGIICFPSLSYRPCYKTWVGGTVFFTDTGAGKGGFVSGVVLDEQGNVEEVIHFG